MSRVSGIEESKAPRRPTPPWCLSQPSPLEFRRIGTTGCEILCQDQVIAWSVDEVWAARIVAALQDKVE